ncbi:EcsC family protein [Anaeromyxobacter dehalogenans]|uniref:Peptidase n=1 Tax=Anaeromyxobacter dehalogenans (strain 2CP-C) TaxID=290397 RepID=Q2IFG6_ANADE|nr:EcsC family protein [Anaeromyxobacter dehalogenans]ABC83323.1 conserved hypothetical protein [Anaeromyxobacter dehalogenans 2CP-C]
MERADLEELRRARALLEYPGLAIKIANYVGKPVDWGLAKVPKGAQEIVVSATKKSMESALEVVLHTLNGELERKPNNWGHRLAAMGTGAVGGAFGLAALPIELPISTMVMLRSVADHARAQGEDLAHPETRMNCLAVFALGGSKGSDDAAGLGYFAVRAALARSVAKAAEYIAGRMAGEVAADKTAPVLARLVSTVAARYAPQVAEKVAVQSIPVVGALGGAAINTLFINHFQDMAWGHFTVRRLERRYGAEAVRRFYESIESPSPAA